MCAIGEESIVRLKELYEKEVLLERLLIHYEQVNGDVRAGKKTDPKIIDCLDRLYLRGLELCKLARRTEESEGGWVADWCPECPLGSEEGDSNG